MPRIREYRSQAAARGLDVGPLVSLAGAQAETGRVKANSIRAQWEGASTAAKGVGAAIEKHNEQTDMATLAAGAAMTHAKLNTDWIDYQAEHKDDPDAAQNFMDDVVMPALDKLGENISSTAGQEVYNKARGGIAADLFEKVHTDAAKLRGDNAVNSLMTFKNQAAQSLMNDPSGLDNMQHLSQVMIDGFTSSANLKPEDALSFGRDLKKGNAMAAFMGAANLNPAQARAELQGGKFAEYFDAGEIKVAESYANARENADDADRKAAEAEHKLALKESANADAAVLSASMLNEDGGMSVPADFNKKLVQFSVDHSGVPGADGTVRALANMARSVTKENAAGIKPVTDPSTYSSFKERMALLVSDPNALTLKDVYQARADGKLNDADFSLYKGWVTEAGKNPQKVAQQKSLNAMLRGYKSSITKANPMMRIFDAPGDKRFYQFQTDMQAAFENGVGAGEKPADLLDPSSPKFIAKDISQYVMSKEQSRREIQGWIKGQQPSATAAPAYPKRNDGESAADYLKRLGAK